MPQTLPSHSSLADFRCDPGANAPSRGYPRARTNACVRATHGVAIRRRCRRRRRCCQWRKCRRRRRLRRRPPAPSGSQKMQFSSLRICSANVLKSLCNRSETVQKPISPRLRAQSGSFGGLRKCSEIALKSLWNRYERKL